MPHTFRLDINAHRPVCLCGDEILSPIHVTKVSRVTGSAKPTLIKREIEPIKWR